MLIYSGKMWFIVDLPIKHWWLVAVRKSLVSLSAISTKKPSWKQRSGCLLHVAAINYEYWIETLHSQSLSHCEGQAGNRMGDEKPPGQLSRQSQKSSVLMKKWPAGTHKPCKPIMVLPGSVEHHETPEPRLPSCKMRSNRKIRRARKTEVSSVSCDRSRSCEEVQDRSNHNHSWWWRQARAISWCALKTEPNNDDNNIQQHHDQIWHNNSQYVVSMP